MRFRPLNEDHAIESVKFSIALSGACLPQTIAHLEQKHDLWRDGLPARSVADANGEGRGRGVNLPGILFAFLRPDGSSTWAMNIALNRIEIECSLYSRWEKIWADASEYFVNVLSVVSETQPDLQILAIELTVKDVFIAYKGDYMLSDLLQSSKNIPAFAFEAGHSWHANSGWFEWKDDLWRTLHNLNCDAIPTSDEVVVNLSHFQQAGLSDPITVGFCTYETLDKVMGSLHDANKQLMLSMLQNDMSERISLTGRQ